MKRKLTCAQILEQSLTRHYGKTLWKPFLHAIEKYALIEPGDRIAVCISGGKDSMLLGKLMQMLQRTEMIPFSLVFLMMDPGYHPRDLQAILDNAALLDIPLTIFKTNVFKAVSHTRNNPCSLCAKMRRGHLYHEAQQLACNKIALGHHLNDIIETTVMAMFHSGQLQTMAPKVRSQHFTGMQLIRPLYCVREEDILAWVQENQLSFLQCACRITRDNVQGTGNSKRQETKELLAKLKKSNPEIEKNIFRSLHTVCLDTFPMYKIGKEKHSFLENYK